ncbi:MAG: D-cysteine desulfhydrase [Pseudomonadota bacterium]
MSLADFPRIQFCHGMTPLEPMPRLSHHLGGPSIFIKRDDCTGLATGGNKARKLEFLVADAIGQHADTLIAIGATQSNHARQTAAAAAKAGLNCHLILERRVEGFGEDYAQSGNTLLNHLFGAKVHDVPAGANPQDMAETVATALREQGKHPYIIPGGGSNALGALGYVVCANELIAQSRTLGISLDALIHATGSAGTQAGLVAGMTSESPLTSVVGCSVRFAKETQEEKVWNIACDTNTLLDSSVVAKRDQVIVDDRFIGEGYGIPTPAMLDAVQLTARLEGILLDPVYTGKAMAALIGMIREGRWSKQDNVVFLHTGGTPALFAYRQYMSA